MPWRRRQVTHEERSPGRPPTLWPWLLLLLLLVAALIAAAILLTRKDSKPKVPDVVGMTVPAAVRDLDQHGYVADVRTQAVQGTGAGKVLSQDPDGGTKLSHGSRVTLVAGRAGAAASGVPDVVGLRVDLAFVRLQAAGLKGSTKRVASKRRPDTVLEQDPAAGTQAQKDSIVVLTISKGGAPVTVPRVVGLTEAAATAKLSGLGFQVRSTRVSSTKQGGLVISQQPAQGAKAPRGSIVGIDVSAGPPSTTQTTTTTPATGAKVPRVVGMGQSAAFLRLERAGYLVDSYPVASSRPRGLVVSQRPQGGTQAPQGTVLHLNVSLGPGTRPLRIVPDVTGKSEAAAQRVLVQVGFTVRTLRPAKGTDVASGGVVADQKPTAGARVRAGSQVLITLGPAPAQ